MKQLLLPCLLMAVFHTLAGQTPYAKMVIGVEVGRELITLNSEGVKSRFMPGVQIEYPLGKFSLGIGLSYHNYNEKLNYYYQSNAMPRQALQGEKSTPYIMNETTLRPEYWSVPFKVNYRLPCNCAYLHASISYDRLRKGPGYQYSSLIETDRAPEYSTPKVGDLRSSTHSFELGMGFKLHSNDYFRLVARPSVAWTQNPAAGDGPNYIRTLRMTFGAQYAFVRYGGKF